MNVWIYNSWRHAWTTALGRSLFRLLCVGGFMNLPVMKLRSCFSSPLRLRPWTFQEPHFHLCVTQDVTICLRWMHGQVLDSIEAQVVPLACELHLKFWTSQHVKICPWGPYTTAFCIHSGQCPGFCMLDLSLFILVSRYVNLFMMMIRLGLQPVLRYHRVSRISYDVERHLCEGMPGSFNLDRTTMFSPVHGMM